MKSGVKENDEWRPATRDTDSASESVFAMSAPSTVLNLFQEQEARDDNAKTDQYKTWITQGKQKRTERMYYNVSFIFETLHKKQQEEHGARDTSMQQLIKSVMMEGRKPNVMIPDTVVYKHGYPSGEHAVA